MLFGRVNVSGVCHSRHGGTLVSLGGGLKEKKIEEAKKRREKEEEKNRFQGRKTLFNPQNRQGVQKRKQSLQGKKFQEQRKLMEAEKNSRDQNDGRDNDFDNDRELGLLEGNGSTDSVKSPDGTGSLAGSFSPSAVGEPFPRRTTLTTTTTLAGWKSGGVQVRHILPGRVTCMQATKAESLSPNVNNYAFVGTADGYLWTFEWENITGEEVLGGATGGGGTGEEFAFDSDGGGSVQGSIQSVNSQYSSQSRRLKQPVMKGVRPHCKELCLHAGGISDLVVSPCQSFVFSGGEEDGCLIMCGIGRRKGVGALKFRDVLKDLLSGRGEEAGSLSLFTLDSELCLQDNKVVSEARARVAEAEGTIAEQKRHFEFENKNVKDELAKAVKDARTEEHRQTSRKEAEIIKLEDELRELKGRHAVEIADLMSEKEELVTNTEVKYEKRISNDMEKYMTLRNVYDDLQVAATDHSYVVVEEMEREKQQMEQDFAVEKKKMEDEHTLLVEYSEYVKSRYNEVLNNTDLGHDVEVIGLKKKMAEQEEKLKKQLKVSQGETGMMQRQNKVLREALEMRDLKNYELKDIVEKEKERCEFVMARERKLEAELTRESGRANKWEKSSGSQKRQIEELEKVSEEEWVQ